MKRSLAALLIMAAALPAAAQGKTKVTWYGHAAFVVTTPKGTVIAIDPWFSNPVAKQKGLQPPEKIDFILVTHGHRDHVGDTLALAKTGAHLIAPYELARVLIAAGYPQELQKPTAGNMGGTLALTDEVSVTYVPAVHSSGFQKDPQDPKSPVEYGGNPVGYVIHIKGGPTIYHTGDTAAFSDMQLFAKRWPIDVMMACIGGHFTMDPVGAARAAGFVKPKVIVPMHFGTYPILTGTPAELEKALRAQHVNTKVVTFQPGETRTF